MRIISGTLKGLRLKSLPGEQTRPTSDKIKESLFNMIGPYFEGGRVLDLYAGSGALGLEFLSRGADSVDFVDKNHKAIAVIKENIQKARLEDRTKTQLMPAKKALKKFSDQGKVYDWVLLDPPYHMFVIPEHLIQLNELALLEEGAHVICETESDQALAGEYGFLKKIRETTYGRTLITIYKMEE